MPGREKKSQKVTMCTVKPINEPGKRARADFVNYNQRTDIMNNTGETLILPGWRGKTGNEYHVRTNDGVYWSPFVTKHCYSRDKHADATLDVNVQRLSDNEPKLNLWGNGLGAEGAVAVADGIKINTVLTKLYLQSNELGPKGARAVADAIKINTVLQVLDLGDNGLGAEGARAVADSIKINTVLRVLDLDNNGLCQEVLSEVEQALQANKAKAREEAERRVRNNDLALTPLTLCAAHNVRGVGSMNAV